MVTSLILTKCKGFQAYYFMGTGLSLREFQNISMNRVQSVDSAMDKCKKETNYVIHGILMEPRPQGLRGPWERG